MESSMKAVILAGGSGTRLWPLSRDLYPKQFLPLAGERSLLQETVERVRPLVGDDFCVVTAQETAFLVSAHLRELGVEPEGRVLGEPAGRNTAPAIGLAALLAEPDRVLLVLPSDHVIRDLEAFHEAALRARRAAEEGYLVTFGITPSRPETGYGYVRLGEPIPGLEGVRRVSRFVEKPNRVTAESYVADGGYAWNSGMFAFRAGTVLAEFAERAPEVHRGLEALRPALKEGTAVPRDLYEAIPKISIDYAVMERSDRVAVVPVAPGWSDLGSFEAIQEILPADSEGNVARLGASGRLVGVESRGNLVWGGDKVVALVGMTDTVVVDTPDALLVCPRGRTQEVRGAVDALKAAGCEQVAVHRTVHRPWGTFTVLSEGSGFKVKRIVVNPGAQLSLQLHHRRSEHWVLVAGEARITRGEELLVPRPEEATFIPAGTAHRLTNPGTTPLEIVEVQLGDYLGEDDIVRLQDDYGRLE